MSTHKWFSVQARGRHGEVSIDDEIGIGGVSAKDFIAAVQALGDIATLTVTINSPGGDVSDGFAIFDFLARHKAKLTIHIQGLAASMASAIAMVPGARVVMSENSMLMIHEPWGGIAGGAQEIASFADALVKMKDQLIRAYARKTGITEAKIKTMLAAETWLTAQECLELGFADEVTEPLRIAAHIGRLNISKMPKSMQWQALHDQAWANFNRKRAGSA